MQGRGRNSSGRGRGNGRGRGERRDGTLNKNLNVSADNIPVATPNLVTEVKQEVSSFPITKCPRCHCLPKGVHVRNPLEMASLGLGILGLDIVGSEKTNRHLFRAHYGIDPSGIFAIYLDLKNEYPDVSIDAVILFIAMNWLKCYDTEHCMCSRWGLSEDTIRTKVREYVRKIQGLKSKKVVFISV